MYVRVYVLCHVVGNFQGPKGPKFLVVFTDLCLTVKTTKIYRAYTQVTVSYVERSTSGGSRIWVKGVQQMLIGNQLLPHLLWTRGGGGGGAFHTHVDQSSLSLCTEGCVRSTIHGLMQMFMRVYMGGGGGGGGAHNYPWYDL